MSWGSHSGKLGLILGTLSLALLSACGSDVYLGSTEPAMIVAREWKGSQVLYSQPPPKSTGRKVMDIILPFPLNALAETAASAADNYERTVASKVDYSYAVRVVRIDGEPVPETLEEFPVPAGEHRIEAKYCRYQDGHSACSEPVVLFFRADAGYRYSLRRNSKFHIELEPGIAGKKTVRAETKSVVPQDVEDCIRRREHDIEYNLKYGQVSAVEADRLISEVKSQCSALSWGPPPGSS